MRLPLPSVQVGGITISRADPEEMIEACREVLRSRDRTHTLAAVNVHTFREARRNPEYRLALNDASIAFVDGVPIRWMLRSLLQDAPPRIHGADLMALLLERLKGARHLFYGSTPKTLAELEDALHRRFPHLNVAGFVSPPFRKRAVRECDEDIARINSYEADVLWLALGAPKQEMWAMLNRDRLRIPVIACVGAAFEILAGRFTRAPDVLQRLGLEWAWRLAQDPWRLWRRYFATNGAFAVELAKCWLGRGLNR